MTDEGVDTLVIGGGLVGCWTALFLARRGQRVTLVDKSVVGAQSSGVNFGNLRLQGRFPGQYPLSLRAQALWEGLPALIGDLCEYDRCGHLYLAMNDDERKKLDGYAEVSASYGLDIEHIGPAALQQRWPWLSGRVAAATYSARDATANPRLVTPAVARAARRAGATIIENTRVIAIERRGDGFLARTEGGDGIPCQNLVNAAGAWAAEIARWFGEDTPLFPAGPPQFVTEPFPYRIVPSVQTIDGTVIMRQIPRGNVILAGYPRTAADPVGNRAPVPPAKTLAGMYHLGALVPMLRECNVIRVWSGIEGYLPDMLPVIGASAGTRGLFHAFGFCGHGFQIGPGVGLCLSELIVDGKTATPLEPFAIDRFDNPVAVNEKFRREFDPRPAR